MTSCTVELTNRCNLRCGHCYSERHAATGDLPVEILQRLITEGRDNGLRHIAFTGGEPTLHRRFADIVACVDEAGYTFSLVSNGSTFPKLASVLSARRGFTGITFSLDGATEPTHDELRGAGSYRRVMRAAAACVARGVTFTFNMVITARNLHEVEQLVTTAQALGAAGVRFGELMFDPRAQEGDLDLSAAERRGIESRIREIAESAAIRVGIAPGHYSASPYFPCAPLELDEFNVDYQGNVTLCCHLSGHSGPQPDADKVGNLAEVSLADALGELRRRVHTYKQDKRAAVENGLFDDLDHFPCWYCVKYLGKVEANTFPLPVRAARPTKRTLHHALTHEH